MQPGGLLPGGARSGLQYVRQESWTTARCNSMIRGEVIELVSAIA